VDNALITASSATLAGNAPFGPISLVFSNPSDFTAHLFFEGIGGDNFGLILDNVALADNRNGGGGTAPEPAPRRLGAGVCRADKAA
jgi:hypothetical protein